MQREAERIYDEYLAAAARAGDAAAWSRLVHRWQPRLLRHAARLCGDAEQARDRVQEAWVEIIRGLHRLEDVVAFPAWALRIVSRRCQRGWSEAARLAEDLVEATPDSPMEEHASAEFAAEVGEVLAAMRGLPSGQRAALALFHLEQLSVAEIAIALDVPPGTVKTRLMHARRKLRETLEGEHHGQE